MPPGDALGGFLLTAPMFLSHSEGLNLGLSEDDLVLIPGRSGNESVKETPALFDLPSSISFLRQETAQEVLRPVGSDGTTRLSVGAPSANEPRFDFPVADLNEGEFGREALVRAVSGTSLDTFFAQTASPAVLLPAAGNLDDVLPDARATAFSGPEPTGDDSNALDSALAVALPADRGGIESIPFVESVRPSDEGSATRTAPSASPGVSEALPIGQTFRGGLVAARDINAQTPPTASNDVYGVHRNIARNVTGRGVLANDADAESDLLSAQLVAGPTSGTLSLGADGLFTYTPNANFSGTDSFTYRANDGVADSGTATVTLNVHASNATPVVVNDTLNVAHDKSLVFTLDGLMANDTDSDSDPLTVVQTTSPTNGTLGQNADGSYTFTPNAGFVGTSTFTYLVSDALAQSSPGTVTINVTNAAPQAAIVGYSVAHGRPLIVSAFKGPRAASYDPDGDPLTVSIVSQPSNGTLINFQSDGSFTYSPNSSFVGTDWFGYRANDGLANSNTEVVVISVLRTSPETFHRKISGFPVGPSGGDPRGLTARGGSGLTHPFEI